MSPPDGPLRTPSVGAASANDGKIRCRDLRADRDEDVARRQPDPEVGVLGLRGQERLLLRRSDRAGRGNPLVLDGPALLGQVGDGHLGAVFEVRDRLRRLALGLVRTDDAGASCALSARQWYSSSHGRAPTRAPTRTTAERRATRCVPPWSIPPCHSNAPGAFSRIWQLSRDPFTRFATIDQPRLTARTVLKTSA